MLASGQLNPYDTLGKRTLTETGFAEDVSGEKAVLPVPVGAKSAASFRVKCVGCMKCIAKCPNGILRPSSAAGGFGRPYLDFRFGWCRPNCNECAKACPAGAIDVKVVGGMKGGQRTGIAVWHRERCIAASGKDACRACSRHCPSKAITLKDGLPVVDAGKCTGCGKCEHYCPARPKTAITVEGRG